MFVDFLGKCENYRFLSQTGEATFWATFGKTWATFYFNIWSHYVCMRQRQREWVKEGDRQSDIFSRNVLGQSRFWFTPAACTTEGWGHPGRGAQGSVTRLGDLLDFG